MKSIFRLQRGREILELVVRSREGETEYQGYRDGVLTAVSPQEELACRKLIAARARGARQA